MERKIKQLTFIIGGLIVAAFTSIPVSSYAAKQVKTTDGNQPADTVSLTVSSSLSLEIDIPSDINDGSDGIRLDVSPNMVASGDFTAKVTSGKGYTLSLHGKNGAVLRNTTANREIPGTCSGNRTIPVAGGQTSDLTCWNARVKALPSGATAADNNTDFRSIPDTITPFASKTTASADAGDTFTLSLGISAASGLPAGDYTGTLVVTASNS